MLIMYDGGPISDDEHDDDDDDGDGEINNRKRKRDDDDDDDDFEKMKYNLVYLYVRTTDDRRNWSMEWHVLDTNSGTLEKDEAMSNLDLPRRFSCAVLGSNVYAIGGEDSNGVLTRQVNVYNTTNKVWKRAPKMNGHRTFSVAVSLGKRIYVFGGRNTPPWSECFDSTLNKWTSIPDPPPEFTSCTYYHSSAVYGMDIIIIWNEFHFCLLDLSGFIPNWHCIMVSQVAGYHDYVSNISAVVNGIIYWSARDLFAFDLSHNKQFLKPAFKFDESNSTIAPSVEFLRSATALPPILVATGEDQLSVIWYSQKTKADQYFQVYCKKFRIPASDDPEKELLSHDNCNPTDNFEFRIRGKHIYQYGALQWHNDDKGKRNLYRDDAKCAISDPVDLLQNLSDSMIKENFNSYSRILGKKVFVEFMDGELELIYGRALKKELCKKDDMPIEDFLNGLSLQKYAKIFVENNIDMNGLKLMNKELLKNLKIPKGPSQDILLAIKEIS